MMSAPIDDDFARVLRRAWFGYLTEVEPLRPQLHRYCLKLTREVWSAEDLVQDTLVRGFAGMGRGDLHGPGSEVANIKAWLFRTASNLWVDRARAAACAARAELPPPRGAPAPDVAAQLGDAGARLMSAASPQERAALVLKEGFDFRLEEIAEMLGTSTGAVKSALHRGRAKLDAAEAAEAKPAVSRALVERFVAAFNAHDVAAVTELMLENVTIEVLGVGGGRGPQNDWAIHTLGDPAEQAETWLLAGEPIMVHFKGVGAERRMTTVTRLEETAGGISRILDYCFCPETVTVVGEALGLPALPAPVYAPDAGFIDEMVGATRLPWRT